jgi:hypothetical protein
MKKCHLEQWCPTFGSWRSTIQNITQFSDTYITIMLVILLFTGFGDPKESAWNQKWVATQLLRKTDLEDTPLNYLTQRLKIN